MPAPDRISPTLSRASGGSGHRHLAVGALIVGLLVGAYVLLGTPGLHTPVANAPGVQSMQVATQQPDTPVDDRTTPPPAR